MATPLPLMTVLRARWEQHRLELPLALSRRILTRRKRPAQSNREDETEVGSRRELCSLYTVPSVRDPRCAAILADLKPDLAVYWGGREIIPRRVLEIPRLGFLGAHWGHLPSYRGMNVTEWAIFNGDRPTVSVQVMAPGVDAGDVVLQRPLPLYPGDTLGELRDRSSEMGSELLVEAVLQMMEGSGTPTPQPAEVGHQFYIMDPRLKRVAERRLSEIVAEG